MKKLPTTRRRRSGVVLLLALLLMAAITASTIAVSVVINTTSRQSKNLDDFILSSLAADSGLERSLAIVTAGRKAASLSTTVGAATGFNSPVQTNRASYSVTATSSSGPLTVPSLSAGQSFTFDIIDADGPCTGVEAPSLLSLNGVGTSGVLDVSWVVIAYDGTTSYTGRTFLTNSGYTSGPPIDLKIVATEQSNTPSTPSLFTGVCKPLGFRIRVRAGSGPVSNVTATPYTTVGCVAPATSCPASIPSRIAITSTGQTGATRSVKTATVLWQLPSSPLFNFVIFTEGPIIPSP